jgi:hypothetical protein
VQAGYGKQSELVRGKDYSAPFYIGRIVAVCLGAGKGLNLRVCIPIWDFKNVCCDG